MLRMQLIFSAFHCKRRMVFFVIFSLYSWLSKSFSISFIKSTKSNVNFLKKPEMSDILFSVSLVFVLRSEVVTKLVMSMVLFLLSVTFELAVVLVI